MNKLIASLQDSVSKLQPREKVFLSVGATLLVAALIYMTVLPSWHKHGALSTQYSQLQGDLQWLHQQREVVSRLSNNCSVKMVSQDSYRKVLSRLVRRNQLKLGSIQEVGDRFNLSFTGSDANSIMRLVHEIACDGYMVKSLQLLESAEDPNTMTGNLEVQLVAR